MAATKANVALLTAATSTTTSSLIDISTHYGDTINYSMVVVGTPSGAGSIQAQIKPAGGSNLYNFGPLITFPAAGTFQGQIEIDPKAGSVQLVYTAQTGGTSSTLTAELAELTGI